MNSAENLEEKNANNIKVSVIIPIYNAYDYLRVALDSVLCQTLCDIEIICIDDGSMDRSIDVLKEYQEKDSRIRIVTEANAGPAHARNNGIRRARGDYLAFLDADDFYEPTFLEKLYNRAVKDGLDIAISDYDIYNSHKDRFEKAVNADAAYIFTSDNVTSKNENPDVILSCTAAYPWNKLFRRSFVESKQLSFLEDAKMFEDVYFTVTALSYAERIGAVLEILVHHRIHNEQTRAKYFAKYYTQVPLVYLKIKDFLIHHGMYAPLYHSYLNLSSSRCYKIFNLLPKDEKEKFWNILHDGFAEQLGWKGSEKNDYVSREVFEFAICIQMYDYNEYKKHLKNNKKLVPENSRKGVEAANRKKKTRGFFKRLFGKNK